MIKNINIRQNYGSTQSPYEEKKFKVIKKISQGAFGTVYLYEHEISSILIDLQRKEKQYAVKKFFVGSSNDKERKKAIREATIQQHISHQNVVKLYHTNWQDTLCSMFMEYCETDLQRYIQNNIYPLNHRDVQQNYSLLRLKQLSQCDTQRESCAQGNSSEKNYIEDLKPSNIMISNDGCVKIGDFGSAERIEKKEESGVFSNEGFSKWYTAPEILFGSRNYGNEVDIWSFACVFAEILNGQPLFPGQGEIEQIALMSQILGTPNEENWPSIVNMPDYGKIKFFSLILNEQDSFKINKPVDLNLCFEFANKEEIEILSKVLKYEGRSTAEEILHSSYFNEVTQQNLDMKSWFQEKSEFDPYFDYTQMIEK